MKVVAVVNRHRSHSKVQSKLLKVTLEVLRFERNKINIF